MVYVQMVYRALPILCSQQLCEVDEAKSDLRSSNILHCKVRFEPKSPRA